MLASVRYLRPYPVEYFDEPLPPGRPVAVAGMGLVAFDVLTALTVGRGGTFESVGSRKRYVPSGREPVDLPLLALGGALLRQVGPRRRPLRRLPAGGVHAGGVRRADPPGRLCRAPAGGLPERAAAPAVRRDAGPLPHPCRLPEGRSRGIGRRTGPSCGPAGRRGTSTKPSGSSSCSTVASIPPATSSPVPTGTTRRAATTSPRSTR